MQYIHIHTYLHPTYHTIPYHTHLPPTRIRDQPREALCQHCLLCNTNADALNHTRYKHSCTSYTLVLFILSGLSSPPFYSLQLARGPNLLLSNNPPREIRHTPCHFEGSPLQYRYTSLPGVLVGTLLSSEKKNLLRQGGQARQSAF